MQIRKFKTLSPEAPHRTVLEANWMRDSLVTFRMRIEKKLRIEVDREISLCRAREPTRLCPITSHANVDILGRRSAVQC